MLLVVLAAGMGRRFGGLKQLAPVGPAGEAIIDYTVHDALAAGFERIALVVRAEIEQVVADHVRRWPVPTELVCQDLSGEGRLQGRPSAPPARDGRTKLLGTAHAVLAAGHLVDRTGFAVANADDLYGVGAMRLVGAHLAERAGAREDEHALAGYRLDRSFLGRGPVSRAVCEEGQDGLLAAITERSVWREPDGRYLAGGHGTDLLDASEVDPSTTVSMNLWAFRPRILDELRRALAHFLPRAGRGRELQLPDAVGRALSRGDGSGRVRVLHTSASCVGLTHPSDLEAIREQVAGLVRNGSYPEQLWPLA